MSFKKIRSVSLPEEKQGLIRYTCLCYRDQPRQMREKIQRLCESCGGEHYAALFETMTTRKSLQKIALEHYVDVSTLCRLRKSFYERW